MPTIKTKSEKVWEKKSLIYSNSQRSEFLFQI